MLTLNDGRSELWQWDTGRKLTVDAECSQVHFSNKVFGRSIDVNVIDGIADIPDILLQTEKDLNVWAFVGTAENGYTKINKVFKVNKRNKPADYVFTPPEQTTLDKLKERLDKIEESQDPDAIKNAVEDYLEQNPVESPVRSVNGKTGKVELTAKDVGAISQGDLQEATNEALHQAKASGEFDGADGQPGADGITPRVGSNGNWFIGDNDTGIPATGPAGGQGLPGTPGEDGGYYTPAVTQPDDDTLQFDFTPSKTGMPAVEPVQVTLPAAPDSGGNADQGLTAEQIAALDGMFKVCTFIKDDVSAEYTAFKTAFGIVEEEPEITLTRITATYTGGSVPVGTSVNALTGITVTAHYSDGSTKNVTGYSLSGAIAEGSNTITVSYEGMFATFTVTGVTEEEPEVTLTSISATYSGGNVTAGTAVTALTGIVVTAHYSDGTSETVTGYTLSGTIAEGSNTVTVSYGGKTTTFTVTGIAKEPDTRTVLYNWDFTKSLTDSVDGLTAEIGNSATRDENGIHFNSANNYCFLGEVFPLSCTVEVDVANADAQFSGAHGRFIMYDENESHAATKGLIFHKNGNWQIYTGNWGGGDHLGLGANAISGETVVVKRTAENQFAWYLNGTPIGSYGIQHGEGLMSLTLGSSNGQAFYNITISAVRVYQGVE